MKLVLTYLVAAVFGALAGWLLLALAIAAGIWGFLLVPLLFSPLGGLCVGALCGLFHRRLRGLHLVGISAVIMTALAAPTLLQIGGPSGINVIALWFAGWGMSLPAVVVGIAFGQDLATPKYAPGERRCEQCGYDLRGTRGNALLGMRGGNHAFE